MLKMLVHNFISNLNQSQPQLPQKLLSEFGVEQPMGNSIQLTIYILSVEINFNNSHLHLLLPHLHCCDLLFVLYVRTYMAKFSNSILASSCITVSLLSYPLALRLRRFQCSLTSLLCIKMKQNHILSSEICAYIDT